ncbi:MAG TPA: dihydroneopterin aldolase [Bacilli bacterium]|uniref:7,8-dihydroneopterin aldolase n=1 Tax=Amphibacillus indicireducens TaxID=1076330 RepID=A0ABP7VZ85_9BACI|nr:dihydroneopterin aldolase [Bacilli bacterium]
MDKIFLNQLSFYGYHGVLKEENELGQIFQVDLELFLNLKKAGQTDQMEDSIHYGEVFNQVKEIVEGKSYALIEAVADKVAKKLLAEYDLLEACKVKVIKPNPPIAGHYQSVAVEIYRERKDYE